MTQIRAMNQPVRRRPGELGVHSLDHFTLMVPDVADAEKFYGLFGLNMKEESGHLGIYTHGHPQRWGTVAEGPRKKLHYISFGCFEEDLPKFKERLEQMRIDRLDPPKGFETNGLWFRDPDGTLIEIHVAEKSSPNNKWPVDPFGGEAGRANAPSRSKAPPTYPRRLALHMADKGFTYGWGLGRHVLGSNYFHYVRDPWGSYAEYSCDIDYIPFDKDWRDGDHPPEDSLYMWGPVVPPDFATNFEVVQK
jgi:catechol 2,3-dioxygenase-like lactoylglutathione lyase family enzyme